MTGSGHGKVFNVGIIVQGYDVGLDRQLQQQQKM